MPEFRRNEEFLARVASGLEVALAGGWPASGGGVWLVERGGELCGSLALTDHGGGVGRVRWFVLTAPLRGRGLGRSLLAELVAKARADGLHRLELETFSALAAAARIYRAAGFQLQWERERDDWGPPIVYQGYGLELR